MLSTAFASDEPFETALKPAIAASCGGCHHPSPQFVSAVPSLHALSADQITAKLMAYRDGSEKGTVMNRIAKGYTPAELVMLGEALGKLP